MSRFTLHNTFHLAVAAGATLASLVMLVVSRDPWRALAGFALLGLLGLSVLLPGGRRGGVLDERDAHNAQRANAAASATFWVAFVAWGTWLSVRYADAGAVPTPLVAWAVPAGWCLTELTRSTVALALDRASS